MARENYSGLLALIAVAKQRNFTRAAAELGISQSMLSHTIRALETRLGVRLLTRTTRSVSVTEAGERLLNIVTPRLENIEQELRAVAELRDIAAGTVRIAACGHAINSLIWPKLASGLADYPQIKVELGSKGLATDSKGGRFDASVRLDDELGSDTTAIRVGPNLTFAMVGSPGYFKQRAMPLEPEDLTRHDCINLRRAGQDNIQGWELKKDQRTTNVRVTGRYVFEAMDQVLNAALSGAGIAYLPLDMVRVHLDQGLLLKVLEPWWLKTTGYHLYCPNQQEQPRALQVVIDVLRHRD